MLQFGGRVQPGSLRVDAASAARHQWPTCCSADTAEDRPAVLPVERRPRNCARRHTRRSRPVVRDIEYRQLSACSKAILVGMALEVNPGHAPTVEHATVLNGMPSLPASIRPSTSAGVQPANALRTREKALESSAIARRSASSRFRVYPFRNPSGKHAGAPREQLHGRQTDGQPLARRQGPPRRRGVAHQQRGAREDSIDHAPPRAKCPQDANVADQPAGVTVCVGRSMPRRTRAGLGAVRAQPRYP